MEDISKNSLEMMDSKLFVGDKVGMKQMKKKMVSKPDTNILFMSGLSQQTREEETEVASTSREREEEERELVSSDEAEDIDSALALSLSSAEASQQEIMEMIKSDSKTGDPSSEAEDDDDIVVLLPSTSVFTSNRKGGREVVPVIKEEPEEVEETEAESGVMISEEDSESDDDDFEEVVPDVTADQSEEDIFADVFSSAADIDKIDTIVGINESQEDTIPSSSSFSTKQKNDGKYKSKIVNEDAETILERITKLDKPGDILSDIVSRANKKQEKSAFTKAVSDNLKNGPGIMMKIASKWADAEVRKSEVIEEAESDPDDDLEPGGPLTVLEEEQDQLVQEMETAEKAKKLLRFTGADSADLTVETISKSTEHREDPAPAPAPAPAPVAATSVSGEESLDTGLDTGLDTRELEELQSRLAAEQDSLVAEMSKAERLSSSITDQMYSECQQLLQMFGLPWLVAPGEAEAQCAQLDLAGLTEGTITDDSDIWLFGGTRVYKNFFNQEKYVEYFTNTEVVSHFGLTRDKLSKLIILVWTCKSSSLL